MADRTVRVRLEAQIASYKAAMGQAAAETRKWESQLLKSARNNEQAFNTLGVAGVATGAAIALGLGQAAFASRDFEKSMSGVAAVANASAAEMDRLSEAAIAAGASTELAGVTAMSAAAAEAELVKAGIAVEDVLGGGLQGSLALATAGQIDMAEAAGIAAAAMNTFKLGGEDVTHVADVLASGANKSAADVGSLGIAMRQAGLVAGQTGLTLEETVGTLSAFADRGLQASDAGTSLRTMLMRLTPQSGEAQEMFDQLGFSAFDAQGEFVGMEEMAGRLQVALAGMSTEQQNSALAVMFGQDAIRGANVLMDLGTKGVREYTDAVNDSGAAQRMAAIQTDNWAGDLEAFGGAWESLMIDYGENAQGGLRASTQFSTGVVNGLAEIPEGAQTALLALGGVTSATSLLAGGAMLALPKVARFKDALETAGPKAQLFGNGILKAGSALAGPWGIALGAAAGGLLFYLNRKGEAVAKTNEFVATLDAETGALTRESRALVVSDLAAEGAYVSGKKLGIQAADLTDAVLGEAGAIIRVNEAIDANIAQREGGYVATDSQTSAALNLQRVLREETAIVETSAAAWRLEQEAMGGTVPMSAAAAENHMRLKQAVEDGGNAAAGAAPQVDALAESVATFTPLQEELNESLEGFVDPLRAYTDRLDAKETAEREAAEATAAATKNQEDSWEDYAKNVNVSIGDVMKELREQVRAQESWHTNMLILATRVSDGTIEQLAAMGAEGAPLVAELVNASDAELRRFEGLARRGTAAGATAMQEELTAARPLLRKVARIAGEETAEAFARRLASGATTMTAIGRAFGLTFKGAFDEAAAVQRNIAGVSPVDVPTAVNAGYEPRALGGPVHGGKNYLVGERGPEILTMGSGTHGMITPNISSAGGGQSIDYDRLASAIGSQRPNISNEFRVMSGGPAAGQAIAMELRKQQIMAGF